MDAKACGPTPTSPTSAAVDANSFGHHTRRVTGDANDYSRFNGIGADSDDDTDVEPSAAESAAAAAQRTARTCRNCRKSGARLTCSVCRKAVYCARQCQASDWPFHKRICQRPKTAEQQTAAAPVKTSAAAAASTVGSRRAKGQSSGSTVVVAEEPDLPAQVRGYTNGVPYFHRELSEEEAKLIGDITPQKIEAKPVATGPSSSLSSTQRGGSVWNSAGTFEERVVTKWAENKWTELFAGVTYVEGSMQATLKAPENLTGDASICVVRGKKRYLFDFTFKLPFEVSVSGSGTCMGSYTMNDISNDEDYEISCALTTKLSQVNEQSAVQAFVAKANSGLQKELLRLIGVFVNDFQQQ
ncbi:unnamed protein product [Hyaloperonospora brassicae]|uniref:MYND-type domain-containing protein n=1 Tax=Hyaloperonospora brassicae TaxID=162125 RepID=A0AAV0T640_HYABA|nr:unnamed protein product [Hyaloperonospora brassicae]